MHDELTDPRELNGSLISVLLPLRPSRAPGQITAVAAVDPDYDAMPFLAARAALVATPGTTLPESTLRAQFTKWPAPVLLAERTFQDPGARPVVFGRSVATLEDRDVFGQPWRGLELSAASLWLVPEVGYVLACERLSADLNVSAEADRLGGFLRRPRATTGVFFTEGRESTPESARADRLRAHVGGLLPELRLTLSQESTLRDLFGSLPADLAESLAVDEPIVDLLVNRPTVIDNVELVEGLVIGLASSDRPEVLGISRLLSGDHTDDFSWQDQGFRWSYSSFTVVDEPGRADAVCALRQDARVAVVDLDALSFRHDYQGWGGAGIVHDLLPLAARLGEYDQEIAEATEALAVDPSRHRDIRAAAESVTNVRRRLALRRVQQDNLANEPNFRAWTNDHSLRRVLAPAALLNADTRAELGLLAEATEALEATLNSRAELDESKAQGRLRKALEVALALISAVGIIALFPTLASMPEDDRVASSLIDAGTWTFVSLVILLVVAAAGFGLYAWGGPRSAAGKVANAVIVGVALGAGLAVFAHRVGADNPLGFGLSGGLLVGTVVFLVWVYLPPVSRNAGATAGPR